MEKMTKKDKMDIVRNAVMGEFGETLSELTKIDSGSFIAVKEDVDGEIVYVEVKFIVKGETFDFEDAQIAYEDKQKKALEKITLKEKKLADLAKKKEDAELKKNSKNAK